MIAATHGQTPGAAQSTVEGHGILNQLSGRMGRGLRERGTT